jgi:hypothetical protein
MYYQISRLHIIPRLCYRHATVVDGGDIEQPAEGEALQPAGAGLIRSPAGGSRATAITDNILIFEMIIYISTFVVVIGLHCL